MRSGALALSLPLLALSTACEGQSGYVQIRVNRISRPAAGVLDKALAASVLEQPHGRPFHLRMEIAESKGVTGAYNASIEEWWYSPTHWRRTITSARFTQSIVVNGADRGVQTTGDYYPLWLRNFVTALSTPVPDNLRSLFNDDPLEPHAYNASGNAANLCQQYDVEVGRPQDKMTNLALICFSADDGLLEDVYEPGYSMGFEDYHAFNNLRVPHTWSESVQYQDRTHITGKITALENIDSSPPIDHEIVAQSVGTDTFAVATLSMAELLVLSNGMPHLTLSSAAHGHGTINTWVSVDRSGVVREVSLENNDADDAILDAAFQLVGERWKPYVKNGHAIQTQGSMVLSY